MMIYFIADLMSLISNGFYSRVVNSIDMDLSPSVKNVFRLPIIENHFSISFKVLAQTGAANEFPYRLYTDEDNGLNTNMLESSDEDGDYPWPLLSYSEMQADYDNRIEQANNDNGIDLQESEDEDYQGELVGYGALHNDDNNRMYMQNDGGDYEGLLRQHDD